MKKYIIVLLLLFSFSLYSQLKNKDYANCQLKSFRLNKIISLISKDGNYKLAIKYLKKDSLNHDFEYYLSKSLFKHKVFGKRYAYKYLNLKLDEDKINSEQFLKAKVWLALMTDNTLGYKKMKKKFNENFPNSDFILKMKVKEYLLFKHRNYWNRDEKIEEELFKSIDSLMSQRNLSNTNLVYFSIAKLDIQKDILSDKKNSKLKKKLNKLIKKYPVEFWNPYLKFALGDENFLTGVSEFIPNLVKPNSKEIENWKIFHQFLDTNPFFDETKISANYQGFPIFYYPRVENEKALYDAIKVINSLINKYSGIVSLKNTKLLIIDIYKDLFVNKEEMAQLYLTTLIDLFEYNGDNGLTIGNKIVELKYDDDMLNDLFAKLKETSIDLIRKQIRISLKKEPNHLNLRELENVFNKFIVSRN